VDLFQQLDQDLPPDSKTRTMARSSHGLRNEMHLNGSDFADRFKALAFFTQGISYLLT
jgi:hypothetical protein